jgi:hypothetical protein
MADRVDKLNDEEIQCADSSRGGDDTEGRRGGDSS